jgi:hypothetical protein
MRIPDEPPFLTAIFQRKEVADKFDIFNDLRCHESGEIAVWPAHSLLHIIKNLEIGWNWSLSYMSSIIALVG